MTDTDLDRANKEQEAENNKLLEELLSGKKKEEAPETKPEEGASSSDSSGSEETPPTNQDSSLPEENASEQTASDSDGVSRAYGGLKTKKINTIPPVQKETKDELPKKPKKEKTKINGKDFMDIVWNEIFLASFEAMLDFVVDTPIDFVTWVLYAPSATRKNKFSGHGIYQAGDESIANHKKKVDAIRDKLKESYKELTNNVKKKEKGEDIEWKIFKSEPSCFAELLKSYKAYKSNPRSSDAQLWCNFLKTPEKIDRLMKKEEVLGGLAIQTAALETVLKVKNEEPLLSSEIVRSLSKIEIDIDANRLNQQDVENVIKMLDNTYGNDETTIGKNIGICLNKIKTSLEQGDNNGLLKGIKDLKKQSVAKDGDLESIQKFIAIRAIEQRRNIGYGIAEIKENSQGNAIAESINKYCSEINKAIEDAKKEVDSVAQGSRKTKKASSLVATINDVIASSGSSRREDKLEEIMSAKDETAQMNIIFNQIKKGKDII